MTWYSKTFTRNYSRLPKIHTLQSTIPCIMYHMSQQKTEVFRLQIVQNHILYTILRTFEHCVIHLFHQTSALKQPNIVFTLFAEPNMNQIYF